MLYTGVYVWHVVLCIGIVEAPYFSCPGKAVVSVLEPAVREIWTFLGVSHKVSLRYGFQVQVLSLLGCSDSLSPSLSPFFLPKHSSLFLMGPLF